MKKIMDSILGVQESRALINEGYKYYVDCDYEVEWGVIDPWSGMPEVSKHIAVFKEEEKADAEAFAQTQEWPYCPSVHPEVNTISWGETWEETEARWAREKAERKAKREAREAKKAAEAGMTVEEYRKAKARKACRTRLTNEIAALEAELAKKREELARLAE